MWKKNLIKSSEISRGEKSGDKQVEYTHLPSEASFVRNAGNLGQPWSLHAITMRHEMGTGTGTGYPTGHRVPDRAPGTRWEGNGPSQIHIFVIIVAINLGSPVQLFTITDALNIIMFYVQLGTRFRF